MMQVKRQKQSSHDSKNIALSRALTTVLASKHRAWNYFEEDSLRAIAVLCRNVRQVIRAWLDCVFDDLSLGSEAIPIPVRRKLDERDQLVTNRVLELVAFVYTRTVSLPDRAVSHKLPPSFQARQRDDPASRRVICGRTVQVYLKHVPIKGWGVFAGEPICQGEYIGAYTGQLISSHEAQRRYDDRYDRRRKNYVLCLREHIANVDASTELPFDSIRVNVDATATGSFTRFVNHSCAPNLELAPVRVDSYIPRLALFAQRSIACDEELSFDYGGSDVAMQPTLEKVGRVCMCGAPNCRRLLPADLSV